MEITARKELFRSATDVEALMPAFQELLTDSTALTAFLQETFDAFAAEPSRLSSVEERRLFSCAILMAGMSASKAFCPQIMKILVSPEFGANVAREEWLSSEISRLLGILSPDDGAQEILEWILKPGLTHPVAEQFLLTLSCRWISRRDSDAVFLGFMKRLLAEIPKELVEFEVAMAIAVNAVAVGGDQLKSQVFDFYKAHEAVLSERFTEKNLQSFFDLGKQRIKSMLTGNYLGGYGPLPSELNRMVNYAAISKEDEKPQTLKSLPPITRDRPKIGRNDPCPCGSGKKYKHCCGK